MTELLAFGYLLAGVCLFRILSLMFFLLKQKSASALEVIVLIAMWPAALLLFAAFSGIPREQIERKEKRTALPR